MDTAATLTANGCGLIQPDNGNLILIIMRTQGRKTALVLINEQTGERREYASQNEAARGIGASFQNLQMARFRCGTVNGWRVYDSPEGIRAQIKELQARLDELEG